MALTSLKTLPQVMPTPAWPTQARLPVPEVPVRKRVLNALTVDLEDWAPLVHQRLHGSLSPVTDRVLHATRSMLSIFQEFDVRGTFFILGPVAEAYPDLIRTIRDDGHELAIHGYQHLPIHRLTPEEFRRDLRRAREVLERIVGNCPIVGHRAPEFSVTRNTLWAIDVLIEEGFTYDSSIFPVRHRRYGIPNASRQPFLMERTAGRLWEVPLTTLNILGWRLPAAGGGYLRVLPFTLSVEGIRQTNDLGAPGVLYLHPHEFDSVEPTVGGRPPGLKARLFVMAQHAFRHRSAHRLRHLLGQFPFAPVKEVLSSWMT